MERSARFQATKLLIALLPLFAFHSLHSFPHLPRIHRSASAHANFQTLTPCWASSADRGGGGGFGSSKSMQKKPTKQTLAKRLEKKYGGTTPQDIARGTQQQIEEKMKSLPPHLQVATQLYQELQKWNARMSSISILDQTKIPPGDMEGARRAQAELQRLYEEHNLTPNDLHNIFQKITWDASADAKAARSLTGRMPKKIEDRVDKACKIIAEAVESAGDEGTCLDVGCGFGVLVPSLKKAGVAHNRIYGVDLSPEMIRNAQDLHPDANFEAADFLSYKPLSNGFDGIIFCSSLHDMPDSIAALKKAEDLLRPNGKIVVVHPQGASHVKMQASSNPVLVKRCLPDAKELCDLCCNLNLIIEPAAANSREESENGYLAVLQKKNN